MELKSNPQTKKIIWEAFHEHLYAPVERKNKTCLESIIVRNAILIRSGHKSFYYKDKYYVCAGEPATRQWNKLHSKLKPEMESYLQSLKEVADNEKLFVMGFITQVLNTSTSVDDCFYIFPEAMHEPLKQFKGINFVGSACLSEEKIQEVRIKNADTIELIKQRLVKNLLI